MAIHSSLCSKGLCIKTDVNWKSTHECYIDSVGLCHCPSHPPQQWLLQPWLVLVCFGSIILLVYVLHE